MANNFFYTDIVIPAASKLRLDGSASGNTYISESSGDHISLVTNSTTALQIDSNQSVKVVAGSLQISGDNANYATLTESGSGTLTIVCQDEFVLQTTATSSVTDQRIRIDSVGQPRIGCAGSGNAESENKTSIGADITPTSILTVFDFQDSSSYSGIAIKQYNDPYDNNGFFGYMNCVGGTFNLVAKSGGRIKFMDGQSSATNMEISGAGEITLNGYGSGTYTGTSAYYLIADSSGDLIEKTPAQVRADIGAGTGTVTISGTPVAKEFAEWTDATTIKGSDTLTVNSSTDGINILGNDSVGTSVSILRLLRNNAVADDRFQFIIGSSTENYIYSGNSTNTHSLVFGLLDVNNSNIEQVLKLKRGSGVQIPVCNEIGSDTDKFLMVSGTDNLIEYVTGDNLLSYIGGAPSSGGAYLPLAGGTMTGNIAMGTNRVIFGSSSDLKIYNDGSDNYLENTSGDMYIMQRADNAIISFQCDNGAGGDAEYFKIDGQYEVNRFLKNARFNDGVKANFGTVDDLQIYHDGSNSFIKDTGTGDLYIDAANNFFVRNQANGEVWIKGTDSGVSLRYQDSQKLITTSTGVEVTGNIDLPSNGAILFDNTSNIEQYYIRNGGGSQSSLQVGKGTPGSDIKFSLDDTGNATFAGAVDVNGNLAVEDEIHLTDGGSTVRGKLLLNSSDRDNVELRAESLGSTMKFFTVGTEALELDASQNATFAGDVTVGDELTVTTISNATADPDKFLCANGNGKVGYRTGAQVLSDIGAGTVTGNGTSGRVAFWSGSSIITSDADLTFNGSSLTVGGTISSTQGNYQSNAEIVMSNSSSQSTLNIGDAEETDGISLIRLKTAGSTQMTVDDGSVDLNTNVDFQVQGGDIKLLGDANINLDVSLSTGNTSGIILPIGSGSVVGGKFYYFAGLSWSQTDADNESSSKGLIAYAKSSGTPSANRMLVSGIIYKASHGFVIGTPLYLSTNPGDLQATAPSGTNDVARVVGYALDANHIFFRPDNTWVKIS